MKKRRNQATKGFRKSVLVVCPGKTEQGYIKSVKDDRYRGMHIDLVPKLGKADKFSAGFDFIKGEYSRGEPNRICIYVNDMDSIVAQDRKKQYEEAKHKALKASRGELKVIESMPCIEFWFLLHFYYTSKYYPTFESLKQEIKKSIPSYDKTEVWAQKIYSILKDNTDAAICNSKKSMAQKLCNEGDCSYTNMHELFETLDEINRREGDMA